MRLYEKLKSRWHDCQTWFANLLTTILPILLALTALGVELGDALGTIDDSIITPALKMKIVGIVSILHVIGRFLPPPNKK